MAWDVPRWQLQCGTHMSLMTPARPTQTQRQISRPRVSPSALQRESCGEGGRTVGEDEEDEVLLLVRPAVEV